MVTGAEGWSDRPAPELPPLSCPLNGQTVLCCVQVSAQEALDDFPRRLLPSRRAFPAPARGRLPPRGRAAAPARALRRAAPGDALQPPLAGARLSFLVWIFKYIYVNSFLRPFFSHSCRKRRERGRKGEILFEFTKGGIWRTLRLASVLLVSRAARSHRGEGQEGPACICWAPQ